MESKVRLLQLQSLSLLRGKCRRSMVHLELKGPSRLQGQLGSTWARPSRAILGTSVNRSKPQLLILEMG